MYRRIVVMSIALLMIASLISCDGEKVSPSAGSSDNEYHFSFAEQSSEQAGSENFSSVDSQADPTTQPSQQISSDISVRISSNNSTGSSSMSTGNSQVSDNNLINAADSRITYFGRTYYDQRFDSCFFNWTNSGFVVSFKGTLLSAEFFTDQNLEEKNKPHIKVYIDDQEPVEIIINKNDSFILADGLADKTHTVKVVKINESLLNKLSIKSVGTNLGGRFTEPAPLPERKIEFIGDSITCGFGNIPPYDLAELTSAIEDGTRTYGYYISENFNTDSRYISVSGAPVYRNYLGNVGDFFKRYSWNDYNDDLPYDFATWTPDLVIINLGTNDVGAGSTYDEFIANGKKWIIYIRKNYPDAFIIWTYGVMNQQNIPRIREIVTYFNDQGDRRIYFHELAPMDTITDGTGGSGHPTYKTHQKMADSLIPVIKEKMGW